MKKIIFALLIGVCFNAHSQNIDSKKLLSDIQVLSSDVYEGRKTGTKENRMAADYIAERFQSLGLKSFKPDFREPFSFKDRSGKEIGGTNIVGYVKGNGAETIVVTAHYDHVGIQRGLIFNGADDNASGVSALLAIAEYFSKNKPQRTIIFAALDAEEMGLQGAKAFVANPPVKLENIKLNVNMDMIAHNEKGELYVAGTFPYPHLKPFILNSNSKIKVLTGHDDPKLGHDDWTNQSDQGPFHAKKIPFLYFGVEDHKDYHEHTDEYRNINKEFFVNASNAILEIVNNYDKNITAQNLFKKKRVMN
ncbi:MAG TPA: M20/M25/M40 family metallo-hydrolase [Sphingobacteriaceae bacterium]